MPNNDDNVPSRADEPPRRPLTMLEMTRMLLGTEIDSASIGRIVHAADQIVLARDRIRTEYMIIGSHLADIHQTLYISLNKRLDNETKAKAQASRMLHDYAMKAFQISRGTAIQYLQVYQRFVNSSDAVEFLNLGELTILKRSDISDTEVNLLVDARKRQEPFSREEILPFIERYRAATEEVNTLMAQLESAKEQLSAGLSQKTELELEIKYLRERATSADLKESEQRDALAAAQLALDSQANTVQSLKIAVERMSREKLALEKNISEMRVREVVKEVPVEVVPEEYKSISEALADATEKLAAANAELAASEHRLRAVKNELVESESSTKDARQIDIRLAGLKADLDAAVEKFRTSTSSGSLRRHRTLLASLHDTARHFCKLIEDAAAAA